MSSKQAKKRPETQRAPSSSQQKVKTEAKFYNGPTVSAKSQQVAGDAKAAAKQGAQIVKARSSQIKSKAKRHPFALLSLISALPTFILLSLLSTVVCPPPPTSQSFFQKINPFAAQHAYSELQQTLCYPSNLYYDNVLQPYVYPQIDNLKTTLVNHPVYRGQVEPRIAQAQIVADRLYQGPIKPVLRRTSNGARKFYLTLIEPHLPFLHAQYQSATAPVKHQISTNYKTYAAPHVSTATAYIKLAYAKVSEIIGTLLGHPLTHKAKKHAVGGYHFGRRVSADAYTKGRPYAVKAGTRTERFMRETAAPKALVGTRWVLVQAEKGWDVISTNVALFYRLHIRPYAAPYLESIEPHVAKVRKSVYTPYVAPYVAQLLPHAEPVKGKGFLTGWFDRVVSAQQKQYEEDLNTVKKPQQVPVPDVHHLKTGSNAAKVAETKDEKKDMAEGREEMVRVREAIKLRINKAGKSAVEDFEAELEQSYADAVEKFPEWRFNHRQTLARERDSVLQALDKLFTKSSTVNKEMIPKIRSQALKKYAKGLKIARDELNDFKLKVEQRELPVLQQKQDGVQAALGSEYDQLRASMAYLDGVTAKDWKAFHALKEDADGWSRKLHGIFDGSVKSSVDRHRKFLKLAYPEAHTELDDVFEEFKHQVEVVCKAAISKHEAKEELAKMSASAATTASEGRVSILPVAEAAGAAGVAGGIIGKGKQQVVDALSAANAAAETTASAASSRVSILPVGDVAGAAGVALGKGKQQVLDALAAANEAIYGASATEATGVQYVKSIGSDAAASAASAYDAVVAGASEALLGAPEPTGVAYAQSIAAAAAASASSAYNAAVVNAASVAHEASRTVVSALGGTPTPESAAEHAASVAAEIASLTNGIKNALGAGPQPTQLASSASAFLATATDAAEDAFSTGTVLLVSLLNGASANYHSVTREISKAAGATPSPETPREYVESVAAEAVSTVKAALGRDEL